MPITIYIILEFFYVVDEELIIYLPASTSFFRAICVLVGIASSNDALDEGFKPFCSKVHTPFGPLQIQN